MTLKPNAKEELKQVFRCESTGEEHDVLLNLPPWIASMINNGWVCWWCSGHQQFSIGPAKEKDLYTGTNAS